MYVCMYVGILLEQHLENLKGFATMLVSSHKVVAA